MRLHLMADQLEAKSDFLVEENKKDLEAGREGGHCRGGSRPNRAQLRVAFRRWPKAFEKLRHLPDPVREVVKMWRRPNGLQVGKMRIPLGVMAIIYEARPNVTADAAALCLKSGNAVILRGGSEAHLSNQAIGQVLREALRPDKRAAGCDANRADPKITLLVQELLQLEEYIDLIIPRGGEELIRAVVANSKVPVIKHYKGVCHIYVDADASLEMAERICMNAKVQRPSVCNAMETLLVHEAIAPNFLPPLIAKYQAAGVEIRGCEKTRALVSGIKEGDWRRIGRRNTSI